MNQADTAWMLISTALVLLMTPALAFFYGGLVRSKNALNTMMMSFISLGFVGVMWAIVGYSLAFSTGNDWMGDMSRVFLSGVGLEPQGTIPHVLFMCYQAHVLHHHRGTDLRGHRRADALLGVRHVHYALGARRLLPRLRTGCGAAAGCSRWAHSTSPAARSCTSTPASPRWLRPIVVGRRRDHGASGLVPHNVPFTLLGAGLLWFGWFGFNAGSALARRRAGRSGVHDDDAGAGRHAGRVDHPRRHANGQADGRRRRHRHRGRPGRHHAGGGFVSPMSAIVLGGLAAFPSYFGIQWRVEDVARRLARRRRSARSRRHGGRAADRRARAEESKRRRKRRAALRQPGSAPGPGYGRRGGYRL